MCRTGGRLVTVLVVLLMACTGCATPISRVLDSAAGARFETVPDLARALRERLLADRTIRFTYDVVSYPTDGEFDTSNYSGDGEYTVDPAGTNSRHRNPQQRNRRAIELVAVGSTVWIFGTDDGTARGPWRSQPPNRIVGRFLELRHSIWLTQLDAISEAFALRGVSEAQRGGRSVVEYRLATTSRNSFSLTALHLGLPPEPVDQVEYSFNVTVDADARLVGARFSAGDASRGLNVAYEFSGWGEPVAEIVPPPADLVD